MTSADELREMVRSVAHLPARLRDRTLQQRLARASPQRLYELAQVIELEPFAANAIRAVLPLHLRNLSSLSSSSVPPALIREVSTDSRDGAAEHDGSGTVVLIGRDHEHAQNRALLEPSGLAPVTVRTLAEAAAMVDPGDCCGIVVAPSLWSGTPSSEHQATLASLLGLSTVHYLRISTSGMAANDVYSLARSTWLKPPPAALLRVANDHAIEPTDVDILLSIQRVTAAVSGHGRLTPAGLSSAEGRLVRLLYAHYRRSNGSDSLGVRELAGGRSGARVFLVSGEVSDLVVKIGARDLLAREVKAYSDYVEGWSACGAAPEYHRHFGIDALTYPLVSSADEARAPAQSLADRLDSLVAQDAFADNDYESGSVEAVAASALDIKVALSRAADALGQLNSRKAGPSSEKVWLQYPVVSLAKRGCNVHLKSYSERPVVLAELVGAALTRVKVLDGVAVSHGDVHSKNILVRDRIPVFVDFASSGAQHPCLDLARLDGSVRRATFRMVVPEAEALAMFHAAYVQQESPERLRARFPRVFSPVLNDVWLSTFIRVRDASARVLAAHSGDWADFLAATCLVSAFMVTKETGMLGSGVERALLGALSDTIAADAGTVAIDAWAGSG